MADQFAERKSDETLSYTTATRRSLTAIGVMIDDLALNYDYRMLVTSWLILAGMATFCMGLTGLLIKRLDRYS